ncbi:MAG: 30S ribosomal protein S3ae, partial [Candidatus Thermoplasmatota archaeon]|nr:30S ribosomal protein S3ae [Candidatus Thermoplasmatota archaeon]
MAKAQRKAKDRWKSKAWYSLHAPAMFNYAVMAWTPADSPEAVTGRVAEVSLDRLSGDFSQKN